MSSEEFLGGHLYAVSSDGIWACGAMGQGCPRYWDLDPETGWEVGMKDSELLSLVG